MAVARGFADFRLVVIGDVQVERYLLRMAASADKTALQVTHEYATDLLHAIQENASGRPGPEVVTGLYRASWKMKREGHSLNWGYAVFTNAPQANRLEYGFFGSDSLGRVYHQPPFPHVRPAEFEVTPTYADTIANRVIA